MIFRLLFIVSALLICKLVFSQPIDSCVARVTYSFYFSPNPDNISFKKKDSLLLEVGKTTSKCYSVYKRMFEAAMIQKFDDHKEEGNIKVDLTKMPPIGSSAVYYKNFPSGKITITDNIITDVFIYEDSLDLFRWLLINNSDTIIAGYKCNKAESFFRGRKYTVWYTPAIPVSSGPLKFNGLPGLILKIQEQGNNFDLECASIELLKSPSAIVFEHNKKLNKTTRADFRDLFIKIMSNPAGAAASTGMTFTPKDGSTLPIPTKRKLNLMELY